MPTKKRERSYPNAIMPSIFTPSFCCSLLPSYAKLTHETARPCQESYTAATPPLRFSLQFVPRNDPSDVDAGRKPSQGRIGRPCQSDDTAGRRQSG